MKKDRIVAVDLKFNDREHFYDLYRYTKIIEWLTNCEIDFKLFYVRPEGDFLPNTILLKASDATALKLKFNL